MSALEEALVEYLTVRRVLGFKLERIGALLRQFVRYLDERGEQQITINVAVAWAVLPGGSTGCTTTGSPQSVGLRAT